MDEITSPNKNWSIYTIILGVYFSLHYFSLLTEYDFLIIEIAFLGVFVIAARRIRFSTLCMIVLVLLIGIRYYSNHSTEVGYFAPSYHLVKYLRILHLPFIIDLYKKISKKDRQRLMTIVLLGVLATDLVSIYYTFSNPLAIRYRDSFDDAVVYHGIIRFSQIFSFGIINTILVIRLIDKNIEFKKKTGLIVLLVSNSIMLLRAQLMTPILIMLLCLVLYMYFATDRSVKVLLGIPLLILGCFLYEPFLLGILQIVRGMDSTIMTRRVEAILNMALFTGGQVNSIEARQAKINISIDSFLRSPITGIGFSRFNGETVGCHQDWFDILAVSGIVVFVVIIWFLILQYRRIIAETSSHSGRNMLTAAFISFLVIGFLDPCLDTNILITVFILSSNFELVGSKV